jgi:hypothetical protein
MNTFRIGYKSFYRETSDHNSDYIQAENEDAALKKFAKEHKIPRASRQLPDKWNWWEGEWLCEFRAVEPVKVIPCPHCSGNGEVAVTLASFHK